MPIDRYYIEKFLAAHRADIRGRVLEVYDDAYARQFGGDQVADCDVWHHAHGNPRATIVGDLVDAPHVASEQFDCIILTQTLQYLSDPLRGVRTLRRLLRSDGVLLLTVPGITPIATQSAWGDRWFWGFTGVGTERLFREGFPKDERSVSTYGNVLTATAFLHGLAAGELSSEELQKHDPAYQVTIAARACKRSNVG